MTRRILLLALAAAFALAPAASARPPVAKPHVVCAVIAFLIVGPDQKPAAILDQRMVMLVPCPKAKPAAANGPVA